MVANHTHSWPMPLTINTKPPTTLHTPPFTSHILEQDEKEMLQKIARKNSEKFARKVMQTAIALDSSDHGIEEAAQSAGIEFVSSLNGIDIYEDTQENVVVKLDQMDSVSGRAQKSTQLRSFCHIETDIHEFVKRITETSRPPLLPGIIDRHELCKILETPEHLAQRMQRPLSPMEIEHAGIQWFVVDQESIPHNNQQQNEHCPRNDTMNGFDFVVLSYQGVFKHRDRRGWMQWCQSIDVPFYPPLPPSSQCERGHLLSSGIVAVESTTRPGQMSVCFVMGADLQVCTRADERQLIKSTVWKQVMKLAGMKKTLERSAIVRTLSISTSSEFSVSSDGSRKSTESNQTEALRTRDVAVATDVTIPTFFIAEKDTKKSNAPPPSARAILNVLRQNKSSPLTERPDILHYVTEKKREREEHERTRTRRAQTMQSYHGIRRSPICEGSPKSLEFRLTFYQDPVEADANNECTSIGTTTYSDLYGQVNNMTTESRTRSIST